MDPLSIKNQAGPAQDPWPQPSRPGPGPLASQAKPARPRTLGPPSQAGPAQDPWPARRCQLPVHMYIMNSTCMRMLRSNPIGNTIGNTIGNKKICLQNVKFPDNLIFVKGVRGTPGSLLDPPRHISDQIFFQNNFAKSCS